MMAENMKTAPFDLEKAIKGHPLVTRNGKKISSFVYFKELSGLKDYPCIATIPDGRILACTETGAFYHHCYGHNSLDLLLDLSVPWEEPLRMGDEIEVIGVGGKWIPAIFIDYGKIGGVRAVAGEQYISDYRVGDSFKSFLFSTYRRKQPQDSKERQAAEQLVNDATAVMNELGTAIEKAKALLTK